MEMEYKDPSRRGRWIVVIGVLLAVVAGGAAFFLINQAQQQAGQAGLQRVAVVVAAQTIPARKIIEATDVTVREIPIDQTNAQGIASTPDKVIGRVPAVAILAGPDGARRTCSPRAPRAASSRSSVPRRSIGTDAPEWRAVSMTVPDDRAVGGLLTPNQTVDVFVTASVNVLTNSEDGIGKDGYYTDKSTKLVVPEHADPGEVRDLLHPQGAARRGGGDLAPRRPAARLPFSLALRPDVDTRQVDASALGTTTNRVIIRYGLPIPVAFPPVSGPVPVAKPTPTPSARARRAHQARPKPGASASPSASPS